MILFKRSHEGKELLRHKSPIDIDGRNDIETAINLPHPLRREQSTITTKQRRFPAPTKLGMISIIALASLSLTRLNLMSDRLRLLPIQKVLSDKPQIQEEKTVHTTTEQVCNPNNFLILIKAGAS